MSQPPLSPRGRAKARPTGVRPKSPRSPAPKSPRVKRLAKPPPAGALPVAPPRGSGAKSPRLQPRVKAPQRPTARNSPVAPARKPKIYGAPGGWEPIPGTGKHLVMCAHSFDEPDITNSLTMVPGDLLQVTERGYGYYRAHNLASDFHGVVPISHVVDYDRESASSLMESLRIRISETILQWGTLMNQWMKERLYSASDMMKKYLRRLLIVRGKTQESDHSLASVLELESELNTLLSQGISELQLERAVYRDDGVYAHAHNSSVYDLFCKFSPEPKTRSQGKDERQSHVYLKFNAFVCKVDEQNDSAVDLHFSLWSKASSNPITEEFVVKLTNRLMVQNLEKIMSQITVFKNVNVKDAYILCRVVRLGKLASRQKTEAKYRNPFGMAMVSIQSVMGQKDMMFDGQAPIFKLREGEVGPLEKMVINNTAESAQGGVALTIQVLETANESELKDKLENYDSIEFTQLFDFGGSIDPGEQRNDFYTCVEEGLFLQERKKTPKNVEVTCMVRLKDGTQLPHCISFGTGGEGLESEYRSMVLYHNNTPIWNEHFKVELPPEVFSKSHLYFEARHCTTKDTKKGKLFGAAWLPLVHEDGTIVANKQVKLWFFVPQKNAGQSTYYLTASPDSLKLTKEWITVSPVLTSTKLVQSSNVFILLNWRKYESKLSETLKAITFVDRIEITKALEELFTCLFDMMEAKPALQHLAFNALTYLLSWAAGGADRISAYSPVVDRFFEVHFDSSGRHEMLLRSLVKAVEDHDDKALRETIKALPFLIKVIGQTRNVGAKLRSDISRVFDALGDLASLEAVKYVAVQVLAVRAAASRELLDALATIFAEDAIGDLYSQFLSAIEYDASRPQLHAEKMALIQKLLEWPKFLPQKKLRNMLLPVFVREISESMARDDPKNFFKGVAAACQLLGLVTAMSRESKSGVSQEVISECVLFMPHLVRALSKVRDRELHKTILGFAAMCELVPKDVFLSYYRNLKSQSVTRENIVNLLKTFAFLLKSAFPEPWVELNMYLWEGFAKLFDVLRPLMLDRAKSLHRELPLWNSFFSVLFNFVSLSSLQLEQMPTVRRARIEQRYGDLRIKASMTLRRIWDSLAKYQGVFVNKFTSSFLQLMMLSHVELRELGIDMFFSVLVKEIETSGAFAEVASATIDNLDTTGTDGSTDWSKFQEFFIEGFSSRIDSLDDENTIVGCRRFVKEIGKLLALISDFKTIPPGSEFEDERVFATMKLLDFLKSLDRQDSYVRYVHQLCDILRASGSFLEAGLVLQMHADLLTWDTESMLEEREPFPRQSEFERKEALYHQSIEMFSSAEDWERAIPLLRELCQVYEIAVFDYQKLAGSLKSMGEMYSKIVTSNRFFCNYFRVEFYGLGFPENIRNTTWIYKGGALESLMEYTQTLKRKYRKATILTSTKISDEVVNGEGQYLLITAVTPSNYEELRGETRVFNELMPQSVINYNYHNDINVFKYQQPFSRPMEGMKFEKGDQRAEFAKLWTRSYFFETTEPFPNFKKRSQINNLTTLERAPIENAVSDVRDKNKSLVDLTAKLKKNPDPAELNPFTMLLNGIIDAAVNGGTKIYRELFLTPEYKNSQPQHQEMCQELQDLLMDQLKLTGDALIVHRVACPDELLGLHEKLEEFYSVLKKEMELKYGKRSLKKQKSDVGWFRTQSKPKPTQRRLISPRATYTTGEAGEEK